MSEPNLLDATFRRRAPGDPTPLWLGAMNFGKRTSAKDSEAIVARALELGVTRIDTANAYNGGESERIVGACLSRAPHLRDDVVLATKCGFDRRDGKPEGLSKDRVLAALDESLARLGTDVVDLYYLHVPDHETAIEDTMDAIAIALEKKKIRAWGVSNYAAWQILEMIHLADARKMPRPRVAQQLYNAVIRQLDVEYLGFARRYDIHTTVYNPLAGGLLSGKHQRDGSTQKGSRFDKNALYQRRYFTDAMFDRVEALSDLARAEHMSLLELSYAWVAGAPGVDSVLLGPASVAQLEEGVAACARGLTPEVRGLVDALYRVWLGTDTYYVR